MSLEEIKNTPYYNIYVAPKVNVPSQEYTQAVQQVKSAPSGTVISTTQPTTYNEVYQDINQVRNQVLLSKLPISQKTLLLKELSAQEKQIREYEKKGFYVKETKSPGKLKEGEMGPPAPEKGYEFVAPEETQLEWAEYQVKKGSDLPPVIREVSEFGKGLTSSIFSLGAPVASALGKKKEYDIATSIAMAQGDNPIYFNPKGFVRDVSGGIEAGKYGVHYPSTLDFAFEPVGLAPKGTTEFLKKHPIFTAGGVGGEVAQWVVGGEIIKATGKGLKAGTRAVLPKIGSAYRKVTPQLTGKLGKALPRTAERLGETTIGKNVRLFAKGYEPVAKGTESIVASKSGKLIEESTRTTGIVRVFKVKPTRWYGFAERQFVPKTSVKSLKPVTEVTGFMRPAQREAGFIFESTSYKKGFLSGLRRSYKSLDVTSKGGTTYIESAIKPTKGSLYNLQKALPITESEYSAMLRANPKGAWYQFFKESEKGLGIPYIAKQTVKKTGTEASASLIGQTRSIVRYAPTTGVVKSSSSKLVSVTLPKTTTKIGELGAYTVVKGIVHEPEIKTFKAEIQIPKQKREFDFAMQPVRGDFLKREPKTDRIELNLPISEQKRGYRQLSGQKIDLFQGQEFISLQDTRKDFTFKAPSSGRYKTGALPAFVPFSLKSPRHGGGGGGSFGTFGIKGYRQRKFKVGSFIDYDALKQKPKMSKKIKIKKKKKVNTWMSFQLPS